MSLQPATARAGANIALVKYWGKRDSGLNLPAAGSISITLAELETQTTVAPMADLSDDRLELDGQSADPARIRPVLDRFRARSGVDARCRVETRNNFPTGAGLASSASGFAALVTAADAAFATGLDERGLSIEARLGSGSAARSIFGGFVEMASGTRVDGSDAHASALADAPHWPLEVVVAITTRQAKAVASTEGMNHTMSTSPYYPAWLSGMDADLEQARNAIARRDFEQLVAVTESSALKMHASALAAQPGILYWHAATVACLHEIRSMRLAGTGVCFTVDAGPQVKAVCLPGQGKRVARRLADIDGVEQVVQARLGPGAEVVS
ncbi:diphosphomevalonate decarboxylase [Wenzhouxiangella sp. AB-CW3]|uniref:diphosphomevalonate decarboxylase n=1 Tax=Wenzhouxiangella sp. AB-CW3 TaxID=2771012 RepID=UPI00168AFE71|nr:diphosphomevalonate decarboxylase [Wenzhouxiangella sp. AB-CW3]QOC23347.1 diphosphomevalonate decarboxylase [Wenzhouxiangella sp. AB-CW3]